MIEMFVAVTIVLVVVGLVLLVIFKAPWWLSVITIAAIVLLLDKLINRKAGHDEDGD